MKEITFVNGNCYEFWGDYIAKGTFAKNVKTGETKQISFSGYIHNDLTVRKAIASTFNEPTFRRH